MHLDRPPPDVKWSPVPARMSSPGRWREWNPPIRPKPLGRSRSATMRFRPIALNCASARALTRASRRRRKCARASGCPRREIDLTAPIVLSCAPLAGHRVVSSITRARSVGCARASSAGELETMAASAGRRMGEVSSGRRGRRRHRSEPRRRARIGLVPAAARQPNRRQPRGGGLLAQLRGPTEPARRSFTSPRADVAGPTSNRRLDQREQIAGRAQRRQRRQHQRERDERQVAGDEARPRPDTNRRRSAVPDRAR